MFTYPVSAETYNYKAGVNVERSFSIDKDGERVTVDRTTYNFKNQVQNYFYIDYEFTFDSIPKTSISVPQNDKEVVLVLDRSGSMRWDLDGDEPGTSGFSGTSRMSILHDAASDFVDSLSENSNIKLSLMSYSSSTSVFTRNSKRIIDISNGNQVNTTNYYNREAIKNEITSMSPNGGTNVGDAFRIGYQLLDTSESDANAERYFVFLSDGEPSFFSYDTVTRSEYNSDSSWNYRYNDDTYYNYYAGTGAAPRTNSSNDYDRGRKYAELMAPSLSVFEKSYFLSFNDDEFTALSAIADLIAGEKGQYYQAKTSDRINTVYDEISNEILAVLKLNNAKFEDTLPENIVVSVDPDDQYKDSIEIRDGKVYIDFSAINYRSSGNEYIADPIKISLKASYNQLGDYVFADDVGKFEYKDINGDDETLLLGGDTFSVELDPVTNVTATRNTVEGQNPDNEVKVSWDTYDGALGYKIYKGYGDEKKLIGTTSSDTTEIITPIYGEDGATTTYYVEADLPGDLKSGHGEAMCDTEPSILNVVVERENSTFIVSWDKIQDAKNPAVVGEENQTADIYYNLLPIITGPSMDGQTPPGLIEENAGNKGIFKIVNNRVYYEYELDDSISFESYDDKIKFTVGATKEISNTESVNAKPYTSQELQIKQVVMTSIATALNQFDYAKKETIEVLVHSDTAANFPEGVYLYDPVIVVDLLLPDEATNTPLEFTYPTVKVDKITGTGENIVYTPISVSTKAKVDGDVNIYITLNDYANYMMGADQKFRITLEYAISYDSEGGVLKSDVFNAVKALSNNTTYNDGHTVIMNGAYDIPKYIDVLLDRGYSTSLDTLLTMKTYFTYNTTSKDVPAPEVRDEKIGVSTGQMMFKTPDTIDDEF